MNKVILMGRLTRDPDIRYSAGDNSMAIARYTLAVDRRFTRRDDQNGQTADFIGCVAFGRSAEFVEKYLKKGVKIVLQGRIENNNYTNREGQKVYGTRIVAENIEFAESKAASQSSAAQYQAPQGAPAFGRDDAPASQAKSAPEPVAEGFMNIPDGIDEELPFA